MKNSSSVNSLVLIGKCTRIIYFTIDCKNVGGYLFLGYYEEFLSWREIVDLLVSISISLVSFMVRSNITEHGGVRGFDTSLYGPSQFNLFPSTPLQHLKIEEYHYT
ncbi:hypothetical protein RIR_jg11603.t1 [Rhizophagus irregularis DAOM 181602=DAOM 197198]|nr:hypothetical protein RIR_jg11603.t1 [Rhizophagus irregularis DAOM 181602=DAOM 197198]